MGIIFSIYNKFKLKNWSKYSPGKRQRIIEKIEKIQSKKLHRPTLPVVVNTSPNCAYFGMFETNGNKQVLYINVKLLNDPRYRFHALETVLHEGRHAYQYNIINHKRIGLLDFKKRKWKQNYSGYITANEDKLIYSMQPIERDAQKYAISKMSKMRFRFRNEEDYFLTLENMKTRYTETERQLKEKHGIFLNHNITKQIKKKSKKINWKKWIPHPIPNKHNN